MIKIFHLGFLLLSTINLVFSHVNMEEGVFVLDQHNFDEMVKGMKYLMVEFYAPWCVHCQHLAPEYSQAGYRLMQLDPQQFVAKVDATASPDLAWRYGVQAYPTILFFQNGEKLEEYYGERSAWAITEYYMSKIDWNNPINFPPPPVEAPLDITCDELNGILWKHQDRVSIVFFGDKDNDKYQSFIEARGRCEVKDIADYYSVSIDGRQCAQQYRGVSDPQIILFANTDESPIIYQSSWDADFISYWIQTVAQPSVLDFSDLTVSRVFEKDKPAVILFQLDSDSHLIQTFRHVANKYRFSLIKFVSSGMRDDLEKTLTEFVGIDETEAPVIVIVNTPDNNKRYKYYGDLKSEQQLHDFVENFLHGNLQPWLRSEEVPSSNSGPVKTIVGSTFNEMVYENHNQDVFIHFYAPWCEHCQNFERIWNQLGKELQNAKGIMIAKFDAQNNDAQGISIGEYPTMMLFTRHDKHNPDTFNWDLSLAELKRWLHERSDGYREFVDNQEVFKDEF